MNILILGSKEYPFHSSYEYDKYAGGGIEIYVENLAKNLSVSKNKVYIITRKFPNQEKSERNGNIFVKRVGYFRNKFLRNVSFNFLSFLASFDIIRREKIQIIHCNGPVSGLFGIFLKYFTGLKLIYTPHGSISCWGFPLKNILNLFHIFSIKGSDFTIFVSKIAKHEMNHISKNKSILIENSIDMDIIRIHATYKKTFFGFLGRLDKIKGIELLLESFLKIYQDYPRIKMKIGGTGELKEFLLNFIEVNNLQDSIEYVGWVNDQFSFFDSIDCFVFPSIEKGHPIALLESMSVGNIIITSLPYIKDGYDGLHCEIDKDNLAEKMKYVIENKKKLNTIRENAKSEIRKKYSWDEKIDKIVNVYKNVLK